MATWTNSEITITGSQILVEKIDSQMIVASNGNATYVDVTFNANVNIPVTRYYFNASNTLYIPLGDFGRALVASGVTGSVVTLSVTDDYTSTAVSVTQNVYKGTYTLLANNQEPQRSQLEIGSASVPFFFYNISFGTNTYDVEKSADGGATWTNQGSYTIAGGDPLVFTFNFSAGDIARVVDTTGGGSTEIWRCSKVDANNGCEFSSVSFTWEGDTGDEKYAWAEIVQVERKTDTTNLSNNDGWENDATFKYLKNYTLQLKCVARGLSKNEACYFDDLFTANKVKFLSSNEAILLSYLSIYGGLTDIEIRVTGDAKRPITNERTNVEFTLEILKVKSI